MNLEIIQLGAIGIIFIFAVKEFFSYLKSRKNGVGLTTQVRMIGDNHLEHMYEEMKRQTNQHEKMIIILTEIKTTLGK